MEILAKQAVRRFGRYLVMEGPVRTPDRQEISLCWVEDAEGSPVTSFTSRDIAFDLASRLAAWDIEDDTNDDGAEDPERPRTRRLH